MKTAYVIYGTGGCARSIMPILKQYIDENQIKAELFFVDDNKSIDQINDVEILNFNKLLELRKNIKQINIYIAIANPQIRKKIYLKLLPNEFNFFNLKASNSIIMDNVNLDIGCIISPFVTLTSNIKIGKFFHANLYSYVEHDCIIGDYVTFAPGVKCNGNVIVEDNVFIGSGSTIINGSNENKIVIGKNSIIGAGSVVLNSVNPNTKVAGIPAREI